MSRPDVFVADRYRLVAQIAAGGMGSVWEAWDERLHRRVALKQLHPQPGLSPAEAKLAGDRAMREARITARLHHPHAVPVYDVVDVDGQPCLIMQYLASKSLQELIKDRGVLSVTEVARIGGQVAAALTEAHRVGIVHRDVKPANVLIGEDGAAKITDFGISHAIGDVALTSTGMVTGTPAFLAPEVARGVDSGPAADVFSLGSTLYAALEGGPPFGTEENPMAMLHRVASGQIVAPTRSGPLTELLLHMLAVDPADRPSMKQVADRLEAVRASVTDPVAGAPTQRMAPPAAPAPVAPPTTTVTLPAVGPADAVVVSGGPPPAEPRQRRLIAVVVAAVVLVLVAGAVLATQLLGNDSGGNGAASNRTVANRHSTSPAKKTTASRPAPRTTAHQSRTHASSPAQQTSTSSSVTNNAPGAAQLTGAVRDYYALLPDNTAEAWNRLTPEYQNGQAGGRAGYEQFWNSIDSVSVSNESAAGDVVSADVRYVKNGSASSERRSFRLVRQDGILKIADSSVVAA